MAQRLAQRDFKEVSLKTIVWTEAVLRESKRSLAALEREFCIKRKKSTSTRSCIWQKYKNGTVIPRNAEKGKRGLVERVDARYPETKKWFYSPLWSLCTGQPVGMDKIKAVYCGLPPDLRGLFVRDEQARFWRQPIDEVICQTLIRAPGLDGLIALFALLNEAEITQAPSLYKAVSEAIMTRLMDAKTDETELNTKVREALVRRLLET